jgi:UDP-GlcNAc:undecaprenyl-phosphate GlcNAc-1-phosphate transferase
MDATWIPALIAAATTAVAAFVLARIAPRVGWVDGGDRGHKLGVEPMPLVGGASIVIGLLCGWAAVNFLGRGAEAFVPGRALGQLLARELGSTATLLPWGGVLVAFAIGLIDDLSSNGLRARAKLAGQALSGLALGLPLFWSSISTADAAIVVALLVVGAIVAQNAINTFDNADGAATGLGIVALAVPAPLFAAPLIAFLPFNLAGHARTNRIRKSILGDAGSHVLGMLVLLTPAAWPVLALPLFDLARLCAVRSRLGQKPWVGDRRHLAHRLAALGFAPATVCALLAAIALPSAVCAWIPGAAAPGIALGVALTIALSVRALRSAPAAPEEVAIDAGEPARVLRSPTAP